MQRLRKDGMLHRVVEAGKTGDVQDGLRMH
jgi:hypothetical protein